MTKVLEGIRVLDISTFMAGPFCCQTLADFGAEVIRIEPPGGAIDRQIGPYAPNGQNMAVPLYNRNKKGITLNLANPKGKELLTRLVKVSDVLVLNMTVRALEKLGIGYDAMRKVSPRLIYASLTGYGLNGPYAERPTFDPICQAVSGHMYVTGFKENGPTKSSSALCDFGAGLNCALGILLALRHRDNTGRGQQVDVALLDTGVSFMEAVYAVYSVCNEVQPQLGNARPYSAPSDCFPCKDGYVYMQISFDRMWTRFTQLIGRPDLGKDPRFMGSEQRRSNRQFLNNLTQGWLADKTKEEAVKILTEAGIPCGPVNTVTEAIVDPQIKARDMLVEIDQPGIGKMPVSGVVIKMSETPGKIETPAPTPGQHNRQVYSELLGIGEIDLDALIKEGVV